MSKKNKMCKVCNNYSGKRKVCKSCKQEIPYVASITTGVKVAPAKSFDRRKQYEAKEKVKI